MCFSYKKSQEVTMRMLENANQTTPHKVEDTLNINYARNIIQKLVGPLTVIGTKVEETLAELECSRKKAKLLTNEKEKLLKLLQKKIILHKWTMTIRTRIFCKACSTLKEYRGDDRKPYIAADPSVANEDPFLIWEGGQAIDEGGKLKCYKCGPDFPKVPIGRTFTKNTTTEIEIDPNVKSELETTEGNVYFK